jgi:hypothetical protein
MPAIRTTALWAAAAAIIGGPLLAAPQRVPDDIPAIVRPDPPRATPAPAAPPDLAPEMRTLAPLTMTVTVERRRAGDRHTERQTVVRTRDRVHLLSSTGREWLFVQNPVDPRRATGFLIHHQARTVIVYEESALLRWLGIRGWVDVVTFGIDPALVSELTASGASRTAGGIRFAKFARTGPEQDRATVWWSRDHALPQDAHLATAASSIRLTVAGIRPGADPALIAPPASRFPSYRMMDLADWMER